VNNRQRVIVFTIVMLALVAYGEFQRQSSDETPPTSSQTNR